MLPGVVVKVPIPPERLKKPYFRSWYRKYGKVHARLELLDSLDKNGRLVSPPADSRLFGTSPHVHRALAVSVLGWLGATVRRREPDRIYHENRICYLGNYIATSFKRARETQQGSAFACRSIPSQATAPQVFVAAPACQQRPGRLANHSFGGHAA